MQDSVNPLVPATYDIVWAVVTVAAFTLMLIALVSIARASKRLTSVIALSWTLVALFVPVVGPVAWLAIGRRASDPAAQPVVR